MMFPVSTGQHWSLLVLKTATLELYSIDSGVGKIFAHSDLQYAPFISTLEQVLKLNNRAITRSPKRLPCAVQPNGFDCGYHVVINAHSLADFVVNEGHDDDDGNLFLNLDLTAWLAPISTPTDVRNYRKLLEKKVAALPFAKNTELAEPLGSPTLDLTK
jgi:hypothetical protein